jgi:NAD(P)H-dependent FMN reductase
MTMKIKVILGSTRQGRFGDKPAHWITEELRLKGVEAELLDLRDYPMPFLDEPTSPAMLGGKYSNPVVQQWAAKIREADAFIIVTAEYTHGYPAVLKNSLDVLFPEWKNKPVGFVGYGNAGGARAIEQLRAVVIELQMLPIRNAIHIGVDVYLAVMKEKVPVNRELFAPLRKSMMGDRVENFFNELIPLAEVLKQLRA